MRPTGDIYQAGSNLQGELKVSLTQFDRKIYKFARLIGASFASLSITSLLFFFGPAFIDTFNIATRMEQPQVETTVSANNLPNNNLIVDIKKDQEEETTEIKRVDNFSVIIPAINAYSEVVYGVDPFNDEEYLEALKKGIAHAGNTGLPGQGKRIYLFAHSTSSPLNFSQINAVFYQLRLLTEGDVISVNLNGKEYKYAVTEKKIVAPTDISWLVGQTDKEELILQTCDPPGTTLKRLLVFAERV